MFVALHLKEKIRVTSVSAAWQGRSDALRELAHGNLLACPGCEQLLWFRAASKKRRCHFAHRHASDCPLAEQSAEVLEVKAKLFQWLESKYPSKVQMDIPIGISNWEKPVDLVVDVTSAKKFCYWVFDRPQRNREDLLAYGNLNGVHMHAIHTQSTFKLLSEKELCLTASQRDFMECSDFDKCLVYAGSGHLCFVDGETSMVRIFRGLDCVHQPNIFRYGVVRERQLSETLIRPRTGELVTAEDVSARAQWKQRQQTQKTKPDVVFLEPQRMPIRQNCLNPQVVSVNKERPIQRESLNGPFQCEYCGKMTTEWSQATPIAGTCICHQCLEQGRHQTRSNGN